MHFPTEEVNIHYRGEKLSVFTVSKNRTIAPKGNVGYTKSKEQSTFISIF